MDTVLGSEINPRDYSAKPVCFRDDRGAEPFVLVGITLTVVALTGALAVAALSVRTARRQHGHAS